MSRAESLELRLPPVVIAAFVGAFVYAADRLLPQFSFFFPLNSVVAGVLALVGLLLFLIAWAIYLGNLLGLFWTPVLFVAYMTRFQIIPEERALRELFGDEFVLYCNSVRRWM
jgi:protein-S-isoprenylcysteine O-methyltransferase Ste14